MTELMKQIEEKVKRFRAEHPDLASQADEFVREYPYSFSQVEKHVIDHIPLCEEDLIQHVGYTPEICGYDK